VSDTPMMDDADWTAPDKKKYGVSEAHIAAAAAAARQLFRELLRFRFTQEQSERESESRAYK
jgi:hypothetical protein